MNDALELPVCDGVAFADDLERDVIEIIGGSAQATGGSADETA